jgi:hypothetical protein
MLNFNNYDSFNHGLITSKLWLCEKLEPYIKKRNSDVNVVHVLGCWTNILSFMLIVRNPKLYTQLYGYDIDEEAIKVANKITNTWQFECPFVYNNCVDANYLTYNLHYSNLVIINTSVEHFNKNTWYDNIPNESLVCLQSSDVTETADPWNIVNPNRSIEELSCKFKLKKILYSGEKLIEYKLPKLFSYKRFMLIGFK